MATDEEVEEQRQVVLELRAQLEEAKSGGAEKLKQAENEVTLVQLADEEQRLLAELAQVQEQNKITVVRQGAAPVLTTVKDQLRASTAHQKAVAKQIVAAKGSKSTVTPTDADETNNTTAEQADNKSSAAETQAGVKSKEEGGK